jgi:pyrimidine-nucleoside phosphorylase
MTPVEFIMQKRNGPQHDRESFLEFFNGYITGDIPDYQMAAWLMAAFLNGLSTEEKVWLTEAVIHSGEQFDLSHIPAPKVDKHSTGGIGDKPSIVLLPLLASMGVCVPMMSGRGLGHTGGTLDKLESIPGMTVQLPKEKYIEILEKHNGVFMAQTPSIAPLDKKLYALRDVTGTVESIALITASIIGKKMTEDLDGLVLDVKYGNGAFMKTIEAARELAESLVDTASQMGVSTVALITDMNEPLGEYVGNSVEVLESIAMLKGERVESRFEHVVLSLAQEMCHAAYPEDDETDWHVKLVDQLKSGKAYEYFERIIEAQGVSAETVRALPNCLSLASECVNVTASADGYISEIDTYRIGRLMVTLKAGRMKVTDTIDPSVGLRMLVHAGAQVKEGEPVAELLVNEQIDPHEFNECFTISEKKPVFHDLIRERIA